MALIPGGAPLCFTLVSVYLAASGHMIEAIALLAWGSLELFVVDKTLRPKLVGGPIKLPFLPTFFGLIGGVKTMGFLGLFVGPVLMALLVAIWQPKSLPRARNAWRWITTRSLPVSESHRFCQARPA
jgi:predicted PurR-regulated permease PerM